MQKSAIAVTNAMDRPVIWDQIASPCLSKRVHTRGELLHTSMPSTQETSHLCVAAGHVRIEEQVQCQWKIDRGDTFCTAPAQTRCLKVTAYGVEMTV